MEKYDLWPRKVVVNFELAENDLFTSRQSEIINLIFQGKSGDEIVKELGICDSTLRNHFSGSGNSDHDQRDRVGIFGIIEKKTNKRPTNRIEIIHRVFELGLLRLKNVSSNTIIDPHT